MNTPNIPRHHAAADLIPETKRHRFAHELATALEITPLAYRWWWRSPTDALPQPGTEGAGAAPGWIAALRYRGVPYVLSTTEHLPPGRYVLHEINPADHSGSPYDQHARPALWSRVLNAEDGDLARQAAAELRAHHREPPLPPSPDRRIRVLILTTAGSAHATFESLRADDLRDAATAAITERPATPPAYHLAPHALRGEEIEHAAGAAPVLFTVCPADHRPGPDHSLPNAAATSLLAQFAAPTREPSQHLGPNRYVYDVAALVLAMSADVNAVAALADRPNEDWGQDRSLPAGIVAVDF